MQICARLFFHRPRSCRRSIPRTWTAALYDRKSSVTNRSGTKAYFLKSLRISFNAACLFHWIGPARRGPRLRRRRPAKDRPSDHRFQIDLVEVPSRMRLQATLSQVGRDHRSEVIHPTPNRLVGHRHSAFRQQILDVTQAEGEPEVEPYRWVNDFGREAVSDVAYFLHPLGYSNGRRGLVRLNSILLSDAPPRGGAALFCSSISDTLGEIRRRKMPILICLDSASARTRSPSPPRSAALGS